MNTPFTQHDLFAAIRNLTRERDEARNQAGLYRQETHRWQAALRVEENQRDALERRHQENGEALVSLRQKIQLHEQERERLAAVVQVQQCRLVQLQGGAKSLVKIVGVKDALLDWAETILVRTEGGEARMRQVIKDWRDQKHEAIA